MTWNTFNEAFEIVSARDVVSCCFIVQRSLMPLDLNACEYMLSRRSVFTEDGYRKMCQPRRRILYTLHLDLPRDLERNSINPVPYEAEWYSRDLAPIIVNDITLSNNKTEKLRRYLNIMKLLELDKHRPTANFIFDSIIHFLYPNCTDSNLVVEFAVMFSFYSWIFYRESPYIVGYVLEHARQMRYNIWAFPAWRLDPINACILFHTAGNIGKLQEYGTALRFENRAYMEIIGDILGARRITQRRLSERRIFLLIQFFYFFIYNRLSWIELRSIWRSIPDPYLSGEEIYFAFGSVITIECFHNMLHYYNSLVVEEKIHVEFVFPRSLLHLCRVAVRNNLSSNFQLPHGIGKLGAGDVLEKFLKLQT